MSNANKRKAESDVGPNPKKMRAGDDIDTDFERLSAKYPALAAVLHKGPQGSLRLNWKDVAAVRVFTQCILKDTFNIEVKLPENHLMPTVPSRYNYIQWIHQLIQEDEPSPQGVTGIDIGCGASCIYPLLGRAKHGWHFIGTDIDPESIDFARQNVAANMWKDDIRIIQATKGKILLDVIPTDQRYDFCMCNPPFFEQVEDKVDNPSTVCNATDGELAVEGGELAFIKQIITDSFQLKDTITWYTSLIGRKVNLKKLRRFLQQNNVKNIRWSELSQGRTARWVIAWSFSDKGLHALEASAQTLGIKKGKSRYTLQTRVEPKALFTIAEEVLLSMDAKITTDFASYSMKGNMYQNSSWWQKKVGAEAGGDDDMAPMCRPPLLFAFTVKLFDLASGDYTLQIQNNENKPNEAFYEFFVAFKLAAVPLLATKQ